MAFNVENQIGTGTTAEILEHVEACIVQVLAFGQWYSTGFGRTFNRADLGKLREFRRELKNEIGASTTTAGSKVNFASFGRPL